MKSLTVSAPCSTINHAQRVLRSSGLCNAKAKKEAVKSKGFAPPKPQREEKQQQEGQSKPPRSDGTADYLVETIARQAKFLLARQPRHDPEDEDEQLQQQQSSPLLDPKAYNGGDLTPADPALDTLLSPLASAPNSNQAASQPSAPSTPPPSAEQQQQVQEPAGVSKPKPSSLAEFVRAGAGQTRPGSRSKPGVPPLAQPPQRPGAPPQGSTGAAPAKEGGQAQVAGNGGPRVPPPPSASPPAAARNPSAARNARLTARPPSADSQPGEQGEGVPVVTDELTRQLRALFDGMVAPRGPQDSTEDLRSALEAAVRDVANRAGSPGSAAVAEQPRQQPGPVVDVDLQQQGSVAADAAGSKQADSGTGAASTGAAYAAVDVGPILEEAVQQLDPASLSTTGFVFGPLPDDLAHQAGVPAQDSPATHSSSSNNSSSGNMSRSTDGESKVTDSSSKGSTAAVGASSSSSSKDSTTATGGSNGGASSSSTALEITDRPRRQQQQKRSQDIAGHHTSAHAQRSEEVGQLMMEWQQARERLTPRLRSELSSEEGDALRALLSIPTDLVEVMDEMSEELQAALDQLSTAQHHVSALQAERDSLQQEVTAVLGEKLAAMNAADAAHQEADRLRAQAAVLAAEVEAATKAAAEAKQALAEASAAAAAAGGAQQGQTQRAPQQQKHRSMGPDHRDQGPEQQGSSMATLAAGAAAATDTVPAESAVPDASVSTAGHSAAAQAGLGDVPQSVEVSGGGWSQERRLAVAQRVSSVLGAVLQSQSLSAAEKAAFSAELTQALSGLLA